MKRIMFDPRSRRVYMSAMEATWWLDEQLEAWLGETTWPTPSRNRSRATSPPRSASRS